MSTARETEARAKVARSIIRGVLDATARYAPQPWTFIRSDSRRRTYFVRRWLGANVNNMEYVLTRTGRIKLFRSQEAASAAACNLNAKADGGAA